MISYSVSLSLIMVSVIFLAGSVDLVHVMTTQTGISFGIALLPIAILFMISAIAETNRAPFDLPEAESELTAGYHTEYSGLQFGFFYLAEYLNMFIVAGIATAVFLGGWMPIQIKGWNEFNEAMMWIPSFIWFFGKTMFLVFLSLWVRWTFPRLRIDQLLNLEWKYLLPINLFNILLMVVLVVFGLTLK